MQVSRRHVTAPAVASVSESTTLRTPPQLDSRELLRDARSVEIMHGKEIYRLCCTRQGKLILTK